MKRISDPFSRTPEGFHLRVEETLGGLKERNMKELKHTRLRSRRLIALVAALLILAASATAVAVVRGSALRREMEGSSVAREVQDVFAETAEEGFGFSVDEAMWIGEDLYFSYTVTVPEDGKTYLYGLRDLQLNGDAWEPDLFGFEMDSLAPNCYAIGGEFGRSATEIRRLSCGGDRYNIREGAVQFLGLSAVFMEPGREVVKISGDAYSEMLIDAGSDPYDQWQILEDPEALYYSNEGRPEIALSKFPEMLELYEAKKERVCRAAGVEYFGDAPRREQLRAGKFSLEELESTGLVSIASVLPVTAPLTISEESGVLYNDVKRHIYEMDGYTVEIRSVHVTNFDLEIQAYICQPGGVPEAWSADLPYAQSYGLYKADGTELEGMRGFFGGMVNPSYNYDSNDEGVREFLVDFDMTGLVQPEEVRELLMLPECCDENGFIGHGDPEEGIRLELVFNPERASAEPTDGPMMPDDLSS